MTLTEVVVYCVLLGVFTVMLFTNLPQRGNQTSEDLRLATSMAGKMLNDLTLELSNASSTSIVVSSSPAGVQFLSAQRDLSSSFSYTSSGELAWQGWIGYFLQKGDLVRVWYPLSSAVDRSSAGTAPTAATMLASGKLETIGRGVKSFVVSSPAANLWQIEIIFDVGGNQVTLSSASGARN